MDDEPRMVTHATLPVKLGLRNKFNNGRYYLSFGEFAPGDYKEEMFVVDWGNGTTTEIKFNLILGWKNYEPDIDSRVWVDGIYNGEGYGEGWVVNIEM